MNVLGSIIYFGVAVGNFVKIVLTSYSASMNY